MNARFGDFTLEERLGSSEVSERFVASHDTLGGPFYLKRYSTLDPSFLPDLERRCDQLMGVSHPHLVQHLGHGEVEGVAFTVAPFVEGVSLTEFIASLKERRVMLAMNVLLRIVRDLAAAVDALHALGTAELSMTHGDVTAPHVRLTPQGTVVLTGLTTPRGEKAGAPPAAIWDSAGVGAIVYDLIALTRVGPVRPRLPSTLDDAVRLALRIGTKVPLPPGELVETFDDVARSMNLDLEGAPLPRLAARAFEALKPAASADPVVDLPMLEPLSVPSGAPVPDAAPIVMERVSPIAMESAEPTPTASSIPEAPLPVEPPPSPAAKPVVKPAVGAAPRPVTVIVQAPAELLDGPTSDGANHEGATASGGPSLPAPLDSSAEAAAEGAAAMDADALLEPEALNPFEALTKEVSPVLPAVERLPFRNASLLADRPEATRTVTKPTPAPTEPLSHEPPFETSSGALSKTPPEKQEVGAPKKEAVNQALAEDTSPGSSQEFLDEQTEPRMDAFDGPKTVGGHRSKAEQALLDAELVNAQHLENAKRDQAMRGGRVTEILVASGQITELQLADVLAEQAVRPRLSDDGLKQRLPSPKLCKQLPQTYAVGRRLLPLSLQDGKLILAVADPFAQSDIDEVTSLMGAEVVEVHVATRTALMNSISDAYQRTGPDWVASPEKQEHALVLCTANDRQAERIGTRMVHEGFLLQHLADGADAIAFLKEKDPDVVLCDTALPGRDGCALLLAARADDTLADTPFFLFGPRDDDVLEARALDLGAEDYFPAPINLDAALRKIRRAVGRRPKRASHSVPSAVPSPLASPPLASLAPAASLPKSPSAPLVEEGAFDLDAFPDAPPVEFDQDPIDDPVKAEPTGVMGTLRQMSIAEICQNLELGRKNARVMLVPTDAAQGEIHFENGQVVFAKCEDDLGEAAFYRLAVHCEGFFRIHYGEDPETKNIAKPTTYLLLEAMRRMDEAKAQA